MIITVLLGSAKYSDPALSGTAAQWLWQWQGVWEVLSYTDGLTWFWAPYGPLQRHKHNPWCRKVQEELWTCSLRIPSTKIPAIDEISEARPFYRIHCMLKWVVEPEELQRYLTGLSHSQRSTDANQLWFVLKMESEFLKHKLKVTLYNMKSAMQSATWTGRLWLTLK